MIFIKKWYLKPQPLDFDYTDRADCIPKQASYDTYESPKLAPLITARPIGKPQTGTNDNSSTNRKAPPFPYTVAARHCSCRTIWAQDGNMWFFGLQCLWRCYAADRSFNSQATWKIHLKVGTTLTYSYTVHTSHSPHLRVLIWSIYLVTLCFSCNFMQVL